MSNQEVTKRLPVKKLDSAFNNNRCAVIATLNIFATKWKPCIICYLIEKPLRYNELYRMIPNISKKMFSEHLKELEADDLIIRQQYDAKKQRVEYSLSVKGKSLLGVMEALQDWGMKNLKGVASIQGMLNPVIDPC